MLRFLGLESIIERTVPGIPGEIYSSLFIMLFLLIISIVVFFKAKHVDPLVKPKGIMLLAEIYVKFVDDFVVENMGPQFKKIAPYFGFVMMYIPLCFVIGLIGLPGPMTYYIVPLILAIITFLGIHIVSIIYTRWGYFKRYVSPFAVFLPINLISMWAPILSLSFRLFGNALSGWVLMTLIYNALEAISTALFKYPFFIAPIITPALHAYFDIFSGFIQTTVFVFLTMLLIASEVPEDYVATQAAVEI